MDERGIEGNKNVNKLKMYLCKKKTYLLALEMERNTEYVSLCIRMRVLSLTLNVLPMTE